MTRPLRLPFLASVAVLLTAGAVGAQAPPAPPVLEPVVVESSTLPPERTRTEEQAREEIDRTPGGVASSPRRPSRNRAAPTSRTCSTWCPAC